MRRKERHGFHELSLIGFCFNQCKRRGNLLSQKMPVAPQNSFIVTKISRPVLEPPNRPRKTLRCAESFQSSFKNGSATFELRFTATVKTEVAARGSYQSSSPQDRLSHAVRGLVSTET